MNPRAFPETLRPERKVLCAHYDQCLDIAIEKGWKGFSCGGCTDFQDLSWSEEEVAGDGLACLGLLRAVLEPRASHRPGCLIDRIASKEQVWLAA